VAGTTVLTLPAATDTLVGRATTDTLTNKTLTSPTLASANITTALTLTGASGTSGQVLTSGGSGNAPTWVTASGITSGTVVASTSGTSIDFTGIPATAKRITVMFSGVSTNGGSAKQIQIGDSGGVETTGYISSGAYFNTGGSFANAELTSGFIVNSVVASDAIAGSFIISCLSASTNTWTFNGSAATGNSATALLLSGGAKSLSATLDRIRITSVNGTDTFDAGSINILYE
jgi:hypothetical protein